MSQKPAQSRPPSLSEFTAWPPEQVATHLAGQTVALATSGMKVNSNRGDTQGGDF